MRLAMLLDAVNQGGSGPWPPTDPVGVIDDRLLFDRLIAGLIPCRSGDPELWFAEQNAQVEHAKSLCRACPLRAACLAGALEREEPWGVWGGEVFVAGQVVATKRGRGRPRKIPLESTARIPALVNTTAHQSAGKPTPNAFVATIGPTTFMPRDDGSLPKIEVLVHDASRGGAITRFALSESLVRRLYDDFAPWRDALARP